MAFIENNFCINKYSYNNYCDQDQNIEHFYITTDAPETVEQVGYFNNLLKNTTDFNGDILNVYFSLLKKVIIYLINVDNNNIKILVANADTIAGVSSINNRKNDVILQASDVKGNLPNGVSILDANGLVPVDQFIPIDGKPLMSLGFANLPKNASEQDILVSFNSILTPVYFPAPVTLLSLSLASNFALINASKVRLELIINNTFYDYTPLCILDAAHSLSRVVNLNNPAQIAAGMPLQTRILFSGIEIATTDQVDVTLGLLFAYSNL